MDLRTNVVVRGTKARSVYDTIINSSKKASSNAEKKKARLTEFSKKIAASK